MITRLHRVTSYSGYRGEESPRAFFINSDKIDVVEILEMWLEEDIDAKDRKRFFRVRGDDNKIYKIFCSDAASGWFCEC